MIDYSISLRANPMKPAEEPKAYATVQVKETVGIDALARHIAEHGSTYSRADIQSVLIQAVDCIKELILEGKAVDLGDMGRFLPDIEGTGAPSIKDFNSASHIKRLSARWAKSAYLQDMTSLAVFNYVPTRAQQAALKRAAKAGENTVDLGKNRPGDPESETV